MGLTIHYSGSFNKDASLQEMISEVKDIAEIQRWNYHIFETEFPEVETNDETLYGITFSPPESEPVFLIFLSNRKLCGAFQMIMTNKEVKPEEEKYRFMAFTKTQYAGEEIHKLIIHLLKYISKKYLKEFSMIDEGEYWETGDEKLLHENFERYNFYLNAVYDGLRNVPLNKGEDMEAYFIRLMEKIHRDKSK